MLAICVTFVQFARQSGDVTMARVLIVEDNEMNRDMLSRRLERRGYDVLSAADGEECIATAQAHAPDIILLDMNLPRVDGWEAARRLKSSSHTRSMPIIALTAHAMPGEREKALAAGCDEYHTKPIDFADLIKKMDSLLSTHT